MKIGLVLQSFHAPNAEIHKFKIKLARGPDHHEDGACCGSQAQQDREA